VLFVGKRVAQAFGYGDDELLTWHRHKAYNRATVPHPSGVNKWWNDSQNRERGEDFLRRVAEQARKGALSFE
jgi:uracil-DNA glycosylase